MTMESKSTFHIWRTGRLLLGITQKELAKELGVSQGTVSKYEQNILEPSASDWYKFCNLVGIDAHKTMELAYIDGKKKFKHRLYADSLFNVPMQYRRDFLLKVRELIAFKEAIINGLGMDFWYHQLRIKDLTPEMFYVYDFQLSLNFLNDLVEECKKESFDLWQEAVNFSNISHGLLYDEYMKKRRVEDTMEMLVQSQPYYQRAFTAEVDFNQDVTCILKPSENALNEFDIEDLRPFMRYKINSFKSILEVKDKALSMNIKEFPEYVSLKVEGSHGLT